VFVKTAERERARRLRGEQGLPVKEIARRVGVSVSSVSLWVRDVPLTPDQQAALDARNPIRNRQRLGTENNSKRCRERRIAAQEHGRALAQRWNPIHYGGCMLYWAEGSKRRNSVQLVNSDAALLKTFLDFLRTCYGVPDQAVTFSVNCYLVNV
jgi:transcriptional regulator with XRE-family HTH domain